MYVCMYVYIYIYIITYTSIFQSVYLLLVFRLCYLKYRKSKQTRLAGIPEREVSGYESTRLSAQNAGLDLKPDARDFGFRG